jgi:phosphoglycerate kinase
MDIKTVDSYNFGGHKALIRVDFNVPLDKQYNITDDSRIKAALPTIQKILKDGGAVVLMSHLGRPLKKLKEDGTVDYEKHTLRHLIRHTSVLLGVEVRFAGDCIGGGFQRVCCAAAGRGAPAGEPAFHKEEEKGEAGFAEKLSKHGDVYVNDAFGTAHRAHASTTIVANYYPAERKMFGYLMAAGVPKMRTR